MPTENEDKAAATTCFLDCGHPCYLDRDCTRFQEALRAIGEQKQNNLCDCGCMRPAGPFGLYSMACGPKAGR